MVLNDVLVAGGSGQIPHRQVSLPRFNSLVATVDLGPDLLEDEDPKLRAVSLRECRHTILNRNMVINNYRISFAIFAYPCSIYTTLCHFFTDEQSSDTVRPLCQHTERREEVAISQGTLLNVTGFNFCIKNSYLTIFRLVVKMSYVRDPQPFVGRIFFVVNSFIFAKTLCIWRKHGIVKLAA